MLNIETQISDLGLRRIVSFPAHELGREDSLVQLLGLKNLDLSCFWLRFLRLDDDGILHGLSARVVERLAFLGQDFVNEAFGVQPNGAVQVWARHDDFVGVVVSLADAILCKYLFRNR